MISSDLARALAVAGLRWQPVPGDRFTIESEDLEDAVLTVSDMTVEVHEFDTGSVLGFNGTTEWALDSVDLDQTLWHPSEEQLRSLLGATFRSLRHDTVGECFVVEISLHDDIVPVEAASASDAYATALLRLMGATGPVDAPLPRVRGRES